MHIIKSPCKPLFNLLFVCIAFITVICFIFSPVMRLCFPVKHMEIIEKYSDKYSLDKYTVMALISSESGFNENAVSRKNAKGLMQLKEETALWCMDKFGIDSNNESIYSPSLNINTGCAYLRYLTDKFKNKNLALAAYNAGEGNVQKWLEKNEDVLNSIPFEETKNYIQKVNKRTKIYRFLYQG